MTKKIFLASIVMFFILSLSIIIYWINDNVRNYKLYGEDTLTKISSKKYNSLNRDNFFVGMDSIMKYDCYSNKSKIFNDKTQLYFFFPYDYDIIFNKKKYYKFYLLYDIDSIKVRNNQKLEWYLSKEANDLYLMCRIDEDEKDTNLIIEKKILHFGGSKYTTNDNTSTFTWDNRLIYHDFWGIGADYLYRDIDNKDMYFFDIPYPKIAHKNTMQVCISKKYGILSFRLYEQNGLICDCKMSLD